MRFPLSFKKDSFPFFASMVDMDAQMTPECPNTFSQGSGFKATEGFGSHIKNYSDPLFPEAGVKSKRVYRTYNCKYCQGEVSIERSLYEDNGDLLPYSEDLGYITTNTYPLHHWITRKEANEGITQNCSKYCFAACFNSFVGNGLCSNNCNSSCTGSTTTPTCSVFTDYMDTNPSTYYPECHFSCTGVVGCLQQCVGDVGVPCYWCFNDTTCNGCVYNCTAGCANATDNYEENCRKMSTKGHFSTNVTYCYTCNGMTGNCNNVCNNTTACNTCTTGCTTACTVGCYTATVSGACFKNCNTNCYGTCTESCTCGCTTFYYSGCAVDAYSKVI